MDEFIPYTGDILLMSACVSLVAVAVLLFVRFGRKR